ncbi:MAG TPA: hypothetical protein DD473_10880 [Planctomycetaceae bacterium]|nr:hypothetical protein [Planctomycetaceae bacterium]
MNTSTEAMAFGRGLDPLLQILISGHEKELANFHPDPQLATRIEQLSEKANEGELTPEEKMEYLGYVRANKFIAVLQHRAREFSLMQEQDQE